MKAAIVTLFALIFTISAATAQRGTKTIFRYGEEVHIKADTAAQPQKLTAKAAAGKIYLGWSVFNNCKAGMYVIERSIDGKDFEVIGFKKGVPSTIPLELNFFYTDSEPLSGKIVYKVTHIAQDNTYFEFSPVTIKNTNGDSSAAVTAKAD